MLINPYFLGMAEAFRDIFHRQARERMRQKSPFHANALAYFEKLNADERYWR